MADAYLAFYTDYYGASNVLTFTPPTVEQNWPTGEFVTTFFSKQDRGVSVLITDGVAVEKRFPSQTALRLADYAFQGGFTHILTEEEGEALEDAGYEVVTAEVAP